MIKNFFLKITSISAHIRFFLALSKFLSKLPLLGKILMMIADRLLLIIYGVDVTSNTINVTYLSIPHPSGVLLGGNGIYSEGRVVVMGGVKFGGKSPDANNYMEKHRENKVFVLGDNVVIGSNSVLLGPVTICDNVIIGAMSLVNKSILVPGIYAGVPVKKISNTVSYEWVKSFEVKK